MNEDRPMEGSIVQGEALRRRALEHRARWEAQRKREEERREREREDEAVARALRARGEATTAVGSNTNGNANDGERAEGEEEEERVCRICFAGEDAGRLFSPCLCRGSMGLVHVDCLNEWRSMSRNPRSFYGCDQCGYQYNLERTRAARYLEREEPALVLAALGVVALTVVAAATCRLSSHALFYALTRLRSVLDSRRAFPRLSETLRGITAEGITTHRGVTLHVSPCYVEVLFYRLVRWVPPWRDLRRLDTSWIHSPSLAGTHAHLDALTGGFFTVGLIAFCVSMFRKFRLLGARRAAEYVGPGLAVTFLAHGSKGLRLPLFAGALYAYARLHAAAKTQSRALLTRLGQRVLEVSR